MRIKLPSGWPIAYELLNVREISWQLRIARAFASDNWRGRPKSCPSSRDGLVSRRPRCRHDHAAAKSAREFHGNKVFGRCVETRRKLKQPRPEGLIVKVIYPGGAAGPGLRPRVTTTVARSRTEIWSETPIGPDLSFKVSRQGNRTIRSFHPGSFAIGSGG
jgi:hypothetical protein